MATTEDTLVRQLRQACRTLAIMRELLDGKYLRLGSGDRIGIGLDLSIGFILTHGDGSETIGGLNDLSLRDLNTICEQEGFGLLIPDVRFAR